MVDANEEPRSFSVEDKRTSSGTSKIKYGEFDPDPDNTARGNTRLSNVRWPLGEEPYPDVDGTEKDDGWVNVKLDVTEHADPDPDQKDMLHGGAETKMNCHYCGKTMHVAASMDAKELLEIGGFRFPLGYRFPKERTVYALACENGHVMQVRERFLQSILK